VYRLAVLGSTRGTVMQAIIDASRERKINAEIVLVVSNKKNAFILERAKNANIHAEYVEPQHLTREEYDKKLSALLKKHHIDFILLIGYMRILSPFFVQEWRDKIVNVHPSLLPAFAGGMDKDVHQAVLDANVKETGCTVHYVTEEVDQGPILIQKKCHVLPDDDAEKLKARVQLLEGDALVEAIQKVMMK